MMQLAVQRVLGQSRLDMAMLYAHIDSKRHDAPAQFIGRFIPEWGLNGCGESGWSRRLEE